MTRNTLEYLKILETIRNNNLIAQLRQSELAEMIANNKRVFKINLTKNQIEKLRNDQLDERERKKIEDNMLIEMKKLAENIRNNNLTVEAKNFSSVMSAFSKNPAAAAVGKTVWDYGLNAKDIGDSVDDYLKKTGIRRTTDYNIPDFLSSKGFGGKTSPTNESIETSKIIRSGGGTRGSNINRSELTPTTKTTSEFRDATQPTVVSRDRSAVISSPQVSVNKEKSGPGIGIAFR